jgi:hypothetical protein
MGDIAAYLKNEKLSINETKLTPLELSELIASIKNGTISGKIGKEVTSLNCFVCLPPATHFGIHVFDVLVRACRVFHDKSVLADTG